MKRSDFIKQITYTGALVSIPSFLQAREGIRKITILHTNDQHSRIEPFPMDGSKYQGLGGFARRASLINDIRMEEKNVLLLDCGDILQGTPYFNIFKGKPEFEGMSLMKYDVATLGNHDFDAGMEGLKSLLPFAEFEIVNANYNFNNTILKNCFKPYKIIRKQGLKIGVFGLGISLKGLVPDELFGETEYLDALNVGNQTANFLRNEENCDLIICLSHLGYSYKDKKISDRILAEESENIDIILGGHTHTFLENVVEVKNKNQQSLIINQVGWAGIYLGRIDVFFDEKNKKKVQEKSPIIITN